MTNLKITVNRADEKRILSKLDNIRKIASSELNQIIIQEARHVVQEMKDEVPVATGNLQRNIRTTSGGRITKITSEAIDPNGGYDYAPVIENYGGRFSKGIYYFTKGVNRFRNRVMTRLRTGVKDILRTRSGSIRQRGNIRTFTPRR